MFQGLGSTSGTTEQNIKHLSWACWCMQSSKIIPSCTVSSRLAWKTWEPVRKGKKKKRTGDWSCSVRQRAICTISTKSIYSSFGPPLSSGHSLAQQQLAISYESYTMKSSLGMDGDWFKDPAGPEPINWTQHLLKNSAVPACTYNPSTLSCKLYIPSKWHIIVKTM